MRPFRSSSAVCDAVSNISAASKYAPRLNAAIASSIDADGESFFTARVSLFTFHRLKRALHNLADRFRSRILNRAQKAHATQGPSPSSSPLQGEGKSLQLLFFLDRAIFGLA